MLNKQYKSFLQTKPEGISKEDDEQLFRSKYTSLKDVTPPISLPHLSGRRQKQSPKVFYVKRCC